MTTLIDKHLTEDNKIAKHSDIVRFSSKPYEEAFTNAFSLMSRHGKKHIVMNMKLDAYERALADGNLYTVRVLALDSGECYIIDDRIPYECLS